jgi:hypothetical protein
MYASFLRRSLRRRLLPSCPCRHHRSRTWADRVRDASPHIAATQETRCAALVRVPEINEAYVKRAMDAAPKEFVSRPRKPPAVVFPSARHRGYHRPVALEHAMTMRRKVFAWIVVTCTVGLVAGIRTPATAGQYWSSDPGSHGGHWRETHRAIYRLENLIALLEADPATDDGFKAPIIIRARADIRRSRATLDRSRWRWTTPCCYSRRPIYIR